MKPSPANLPVSRPALERLAELRTHPNFVTYSERNRAGRRRTLWFSIHGVCSTGEILVEITDGRAQRVRSFFSRHKNCPPEDRRQAMTLVDAADAYELARQMARHWPAIRPKRLPRGL
jgi:hypothetical protein